MSQQKCFLVRLLIYTQGIKIKAVLYFKSTKDKALSRMQNRAMTSDRIRVDDTYAIFQERYKGFLGEIHAIEEYYEQQGKLWEVRRLTCNVQLFSDTYRSIAKAPSSKYTSSS